MWHDVACCDMTQIPCTQSMIAAALAATGLLTASFFLTSVFGCSGDEVADFADFDPEQTTQVNPMEFSSACSFRIGKTNGMKHGFYMLTKKYRIKREMYYNQLTTFSGVRMFEVLPA